MLHPAKHMYDFGCSVVKLSELGNTSMKLTNKELKSKPIFWIPLREQNTRIQI